MSFLRHRRPPDPDAVRALLARDRASANRRELRVTTLVEFRCNLCGRDNRVPYGRMSREAPTCDGCGSSVRFRAIVHLLGIALFGRSIPLDRLPSRKDLTGIGLSDAPIFARTLAARFDYTNTYLHQAPHADITKIDGALAGRHDFLIASEVFEHVAPPVDIAFANARRLLKPGGVMIFTVPYSDGEATIEHYPELHDWRIVRAGAGFEVENVTVDGRVQRFADPVFHGGPGSTLELREFSRRALVAHLRTAGFRDVHFVTEPCAAHGIYWALPWSVPMLAWA